MSCLSLTYFTEYNTLQIHPCWCNDKTSFFTANLPLYEHTRVFFAHSSVGGHSGGPASIFSHECFCFRKTPGSGPLDRTQPQPTRSPPRSPHWLLFPPAAQRLQCPLGTHALEGSRMSLLLLEMLLKNYSSTSPRSRLRLT